MPFASWYLPDVSGGFLIALIAVIHVFVAQFAVGGGLFLVLAERKAHRENSPGLFAWVQGHAKFFLLLTMVFGGLTGVGIWLIISLVSPSGTSFLVNTFLYAWATEWVFFLAEIIALLLYVGSFSRCASGAMTQKDHMALGWWYFLFAFLSLFAVNGIITFMATPGEWLTTKNFWHAFFNPTFWPSLVFRGTLCLLFAGIFGLVTATRINDATVRHTAIQTCATWICAPLFLLFAATFWYYHALPPELHESMARKTADIRPFVRSFIDTIPLLLLAGIVLFIRLPKRLYVPVVACMLALGLVVGGTFEWVRETTRRPWLIRGHMYSNGLTVEQSTRLRELGTLRASPWAGLMVARALAEEQGKALKPLPVKTADAQETAASSPAGADAPLALPAVAKLSPQAAQAYARAIYAEQCATCHGLSGPMLNMRTRLQGRPVTGIASLINAQGTISPYMPPFFGTAEDIQILARWLAAQAETPGTPAAAPATSAAGTGAASREPAQPPAQTARQPVSPQEPTPAAQLSGNPAPMSAAPAAQLSGSPAHTPEAPVSSATPERSS